MKTATENCVHWYMLETPHGPGGSLGRCKHCPATKRYENVGDSDFTGSQRILRECLECGKGFPKIMTYYKFDLKRKRWSDRCRSCDEKERTG